MTTETEWNQRECPHCHAPLTEADMGRVHRLARTALSAEPVSVGFENNWSPLECGHRVEVVVDARPDGFNFKLVDRSS